MACFVHFNHFNGTFILVLRCHGPFSKNKTLNDNFKITLVYILFTEITKSKPPFMQRVYFLI